MPEVRFGREELHSQILPAVARPVDGDNPALPSAAPSTLPAASAGVLCSENEAGTFGKTSSKSRFVNPRGFRPASVDAFLPTESCQQGAEATEQQKRSDEHEPCPHSPNTACLPLTGQWRNGTTKSDPITVPSYSFFAPFGSFRIRNKSQFR